ncbi:response regulator [Phenylobacterium sp. J426]|uniref:response regulator transcription factor n=1 Tax=Phenylobacterium sp. J426 TaxID=2898439 RepID=UPI002150E94C|nr:response regulator [Phenylobacterium sp. J426]MCR5873870.1 response regulator [Phenylobacterium sp. J426]
MASTRTVHVVDDDELLRDFTDHALSQAGYQVLQHPTGEDFLSALAEAEAGCILLDIQMPGLSGLQVQEALKARGVAWPVVVLTGRGDVRIAVEAMKNGAYEFLEKPYEPAALTATLEAAFEAFEAEREARAEVARAEALIATLSARELQVMQGLLAGMPNKIIAYALGLSVRTVEIYRANVMDKLKARGLSTAVRLALAAGVEPLPDPE